MIRAGLDLILEADALVALLDDITVEVAIYPEQFLAEQQQSLVHPHISTL